jgi:prepilin-type N-terminal cleavage/methylation domain-containing protein
MGIGATDGRRGANDRRGTRGRRRAGFTLIELMIAVCIIGVLASVAIPAYSRFVIEARAGEVPLNLASLYKAAVSYYEAPASSGRGMGATAAGRCIMNECCDGMMGTVPPFPPGPEKRLADWSVSADMSGTGFGPSGMMYGSYAWAVPEPEAVTKQCGITQASFASPLPIAYTFFGLVDLDGDGMMGGAGLQVGIRGEQLYREPGLTSLKTGFELVGDTCAFCADTFAD